MPRRQQYIMRSRDSCVRPRGSGLGPPPRSIRPGSSWSGCGPRNTAGDGSNCMTRTRNGGTMAKQKRDTTWYVLACESGGYLGTQWEGNSSGGVVRPRKAVMQSLYPPAYNFISIYCGKDEAIAEARRTEEILPEGFHPVPVKIMGAGKDSRIILQ